MFILTQEQITKAVDWWSKKLIKNSQMCFSFSSSGCHCQVKDIITKEQEDMFKHVLTDLLNLSHSTPQGLYIDSDGHPDMILENVLYQANLLIDKNLRDIVMVFLQNGRTLVSSGAKGLMEEI